MTANKITYVYINKETWHKHKLSEQEANEYHKRLLMQGNILTVIEDNELKAYIEVWKINYEQLGRLMCGETVYALEENITDGNIAYVNNGWVDNDKVVSKKLQNKFMNRFKECKYIARKRFKYNEAFKVYPMGMIGA